MFGFQTSSASEVSSAADQLLAALADPAAAQAFLKSIDDKIVEFTKIRDDAMSSLKDAESKVASANDAMAEVKRLASLNTADKVNLEQATAALMSRVADVGDRENALGDTANKINADLKSQRDKLDADRAAFENAQAAGLQSVQDAKTIFNNMAASANADIAKRLAEASDLRNKASQDSAMAADLKAMWEGKVKAFNALAQSLTTPVL